MSHTIISSSTIEFSIFKDFNFDKNIHSLSDCSSNYSPLVLKIPIRLLSASLKIITRIIWAQFHLFTNNLLTPPSENNSTNNIVFLVETNTSEINSVVDCVTSRKLGNEFYKLDINVRIITTKKNRVRKNFEKKTYVWRQYYHEQTLVRSQRLLIPKTPVLMEWIPWVPFSRRHSKWKVTKRFKSSYQFSPSLFHICRFMHTQMKKKQMPLL